MMTGGENRERERFVRVKWSDSRQRKRERVGFCVLIFLEKVKGSIQDLIF